MSELRKKDLSDPNNLVIVPLAEYSLSQFRPQARASIPGGLAELQQSVYACVQVGRMDRAASLIRFMTRSLYPEAPELQDVHLKYITVLADALMREPSNDKLVGLQKWIELDMRSFGVPIGHRILILLMKSTFLTLEGSKLDRTLRRYMGWAGDSQSEEVQEMLSSPLFSEAEWDKLMRLAGREGEANAYEESLTNLSPSVEEPSADHNSLDVEITLTESDQLPTPSSSINFSEPLSLIETQQKGLGLSALKASLISLQSHELKNIQPEDGKDPRVVLQERLESDVLDSAMQRWREESANAKYDNFETHLSSSGLGAHLYRWCTGMTRAAQSELDRADRLLTTTNAQKDSKANMELFMVAPWLKLVDLEKICAAALVAFTESVLEQNLRNRQKAQNRDILYPIAIAPLRSVLQSVGKAVLTESRAERLLEANKLEKLTKMPSKERKRIVRQLFRKESKKTREAIMAGKSVELSHQDTLSTEVVLRIAAFLLSIMFKEAKLPVRIQNPDTKKLELQMQPIAKHSYFFSDGKKHGGIEMHPELQSRLKREPPVGIIAKHLPMLAPPRPWTSLNQGGYLTSATEAVRTKDAGLSGQAYLKLADKRGDMKQIYAALDGLGEVAWRINQPIFDIVSRVWNTGEKFAKLAPLEPETNLPSEPDPSDPVACTRWRRVVRMIENQTNSYHSQRCFQNFQLEVAKSFINDDFYCPHNIDFRGRAYPLPPYLNHMGPDYIRALFTFAKGRELGERGLYWLKVHLANTFGFDKAPMDDRARFTEEHVRDIYDSAEHPLDGQQWWLKSDDPWQTLAACVEVRNALEAPVPSKFVSSLPIQQDGSCNGLQHYAALGGDTLGAEQVNLAPADKPGDVYTGVLRLVQKQVDIDAAKGDKRAQALQGRLTRKCVKQPVMTNVYGVTWIGAKAQVKKQLVNVFSPAEVSSGQADLSELSGYVATLIFDSLREMFTGAHAIQQWLGECGLRISRALTPEQLARIEAKHDGSAEQTPAPVFPAGNQAASKKWLANVNMDDYRFKSSIVWTTPLGLPVVQPYRESAVKQIETSISSVRVQMDNTLESVDKRRQLQGLPPNFIHSLDASHMMLTSLRFRELGLTFAAIHDGFWTHAADIDRLSVELRDAFVRMHGEDIVGRLREEFTARYRGCMEWVPVFSNTPIAKRITQHYKDLKRKNLAAYRKTNTAAPSVAVDALREQTRLRLLDSQDPAEVEQGRNMVTAASIFEAYEREEADKAAAAVASEPLTEQTIPEPSVTEAENEVLEQHMASVSAETSHPPADDPASADAQPPVDGPEAKPKRKVNPSRIHFWRRLAFPPAPTKGSFDVSRVRDSRYFFS